MDTGFFNKFLDIFGMGEDNDYVNDEDEIIEQEKSDKFELIQNSKKNKIVSIHSSSNAKVVIMEPEELEEIMSLCDSLKNRKIVIINLEKLDSKLAQRFVDFAGGAAYALDGDIQKVSPGILLITPNNVEVSSELKTQLSNAGFFNWNSNR